MRHALVTCFAIGLMCWGCGSSSSGGGSRKPVVTATISGACRGTWSSDGYGASGLFATTLVQQGRALSGSVTVEGAPFPPDMAVTGTVDSNRLTFGDVGGQISFTGQVTAATDTTFDIGGTYNSAPIQDTGSWNAHCTSSGVQSDAGADSRPSDSGVEVPPVAPCVRAGMIKASTALDVTLAGSMAYLADGVDGLRIIDVTNAQAPAIVGTAPVPPGGDFASVASDGTYAYVLDAQHGLVVIDVRQPPSPKTVSTLKLVDGMIPPPGSATGGGVALYDSKVFVGGTFAMHGCTVDVSDPMSPKSLGCSSDLRSVLDAQAASQVIYVSSNFGLFVVNGLSPTGPVVLGKYDMQGSQGSFGIMYPYVALGDGMQAFSVVDVSNANQPHKVGSLSLPAMATAVMQSYALVAEETRLHIIDLRQPAQPTEVGVCASPSGEEHAWVNSRLRVVGDRAYLTLQSKGLSIWKIDTTKLP